MSLSYNLPHPLFWKGRGQARQLWRGKD
ncbi:putative membrane protein, partial [Chlamydia psittaci 84-8471/1]